MSSIHKMARNMSINTPRALPVESENMVELEERSENLKSQISSVAKVLNKGASSLSSASSSSLAKIEATLESLTDLYGDERSPAFVTLVLRMVKKRSEAETQFSSTVHPCIADLKRSAEELLLEISNHREEFHAAKECVAEYALFALEEFLKGAIKN
ncbi:hypothetical protein KJ359_011361 [Pestalotiopsis sp. 9143b]|nr:hypothetical protein KJ359_011361 [Pestalotiopsis sp. 9143b]